VILLLQVQLLEVQVAADNRLAPYGALVLRVALGAMYLAHSVVLKLMTLGLPGTADFFSKVGLPGWLAYVTFGAEAVGGVLLVLGIWTRAVAISLILPLIGAIIWVHAANGWVFTAQGGGWEYPAFLVAASVAMALLGDGAYAVRRAADAASGRNHRSQTHSLARSSSGFAWRIRA
jgi:putative oxidoreductase